MFLDLVCIAVSIMARIINNETLTHAIQEKVFGRYLGTSQTQNEMDDKKCYLYNAFTDEEAIEYVFTGKDANVI